MKYPELIRTWNETPLALLPSKISEIASFLARKSRGEDIPEADVKAAAATRKRNDARQQGETVIIPVLGTLGNRVSLLEQASGGVGCDQISRALDRAVAAADCSSIVLLFESPGGSVAGIPELAQKIREARARKPVIGVADCMAASACDVADRAVQ